MQVISTPQAYQFLARLNKEYSLAGRGGASPAQEPAKASGGALHRMVVVISGVQLKHRVDSLGLIEGLNLFRILPDAPQNWVSGFALLVPQGEIYAVGPTLWLVKKDVLLHAGIPEGAGHAPYMGK